MKEHKKSKEKFDLYQVVTDQIIEAMERGVCPWKKPWRATGGCPRNIRGRRYRGINALLLAMQSALSNWTHPVFLTFNQAKELGGTVRKGERSSIVVLWKTTVPEKYATNPQACPASERKWLIRYYRVFNVAQVDGLPPQALPEIPDNDLSPIEACEAIVAGMPQRPPIRESGQGAYYFPAKDEVFMPPLRAFDSAEAYHSTLFHELTHSTGADSRLARPEAFAGRFGSEPYAKEELVAELGAVFLCARAGIAPATLEDSAAYLANWLKKLREDKRLIITAASAAQRAADFIAPETIEDEEATEPEAAEPAELAVA
ncbi:zincin-like metallopeptidase domain-containing protein [Luteolibacter sp.]|uniref:ArdC family protein n=1 Tax=Luteolibacter sp. TaxID=1962973 RepID=UPI003267F873